MRLFIGIDLPAQIKHIVHQYLIPFQKNAKGWEQPHDYHQTLLFIGETPSERIQDILHRLEKIKLSPFQLETDGFHFFNRRIMYLGFKPSEELLKLRKMVQETYPEWSQKESKEFIPHVTVKRWQRYEYEDLAKGLNEPMKSLSFMVDHLALFKSEKDSHNNKYHIIQKNFF